MRDQTPKVPKLPLTDAPEADYGSEEPAMVRYRDEGTRRALALGNRGPMRFDANGRVAPAILRRVLALRLLHLRTRDRSTRTRRHRTRSDRHAGAATGDTRRIGRSPRAPRVGCGPTRPTDRLGEAARRPARRHVPRPRPSSGEDVRAACAGRCTGVRRAADTRAAAVLGGVSARCAAIQNCSRSRRRSMART